MAYLGTIFGETALNLKTAKIHQGYNNTCGVKVQQLALEKMGIKVTEDQLIQEALDNGWFTEEAGTQTKDLGKLMELHGVPVHRIENGNIFNLMNEFIQGHQVIMAVDSGELWNPGIKELIEDIFFEIEDHAILVCGINTDDPKNVKVVVTDTGACDLRKEYPMQQFVNAAKDSDFYIVATDQPVPHVFDSFGEGTEHLPSIGDMPYDYFRNNYAFLKDVSNRPVFEEFVSRINSTSSPSFMGEDSALEDDDELFECDDSSERDDEDPFSSEDNPFDGYNDDPFNSDDNNEFL